MEGLFEERSEKVIEGRQVERKGQQWGTMETNNESSYIGVDIYQPRPYKGEMRGRTVLHMKTSMSP